MELQGLAADGAPVGRGGAGHGVPAIAGEGQDVIPHQRLAQLIGPVLCRCLAVGHHQQIGVGEPVPVAAGQRAEQSDRAVGGSERLVQLLPQESHPALAFALPQPLKRA